jgi:hypothetical protein
MVNMKQGPLEPTIDYTKEIKQESNVFRSFYGDDVFYHLIELQPEYQNETDPAKQEAMKKNAFEAWGGHVIIACADPIRYGTLQKQIQSQFSLGQNQYADSMEKGTDTLSNHKTDAKYYEIQKRNHEQAKAVKEEEQTKMISFTQKEKEWICYCCGKKGHTSNACRQKDIIPKKDSYFNKALQNYQEQETNDGDDTQSVQSTPSNTGHQHRRSEQHTNSARTQQTQANNRSNPKHTAWNGFQGFQ